MSNGVSFRGAVAGYNKKDVNEYIMKADKEFSDYKAAAEEEKARIDAELKEAGRRISELTEKLDAASSDCDAANAQCRSLTEKADELSAKIDAISAELAEKSSALIDAERETGTLKAEKAVSDRMLEEAKKKISEMSAAECTEDEICEAIGDKLNALLIAANKEAEEIVTGAMNRSDEIIDDAKKRAEEIVMKATSDADGLSEKNAENMRRIAKEIATEYCDEVTLFATELRDSFNALLRDISAKGLEMSGKLDYLSASVGNDLEKRIIDVTAEKAITEAAEEKDAKPKTAAQAALETINDRIDSFVKSAIAAFSKLRRGKNDK